MNSIKEYFTYLYSLERRGMKYDLGNITAILKHLNNPHRTIKFIHIAGTNGKGATASLIASILKEHRFKTGLFTSPHILKFNERIRINGRMISNAYIKQFLKDNLNLIRKIKPSFFEVNTALAFKYFADKKTDIAIVEAGLGGRLDSTNIILPELSIITQIGMDHMQFLGDTIEKITKEKLGIVKKGVDVIVSDNNPKLKKVFTSKAGKNELYFIDDYAKITKIRKENTGTIFNLEFKDKNDSILHKLKLLVPLSGNYQLRNAAAAILASYKYILKSGKRFSNSDTVNGVRNVKTNTGYHARFEKIRSRGINYIFDISHNPDGIKTSLENSSSEKPDVIVFGIMSDKDYMAATEEVLKHSDIVIFTKPNYERALAPEVLMTYSKPLITKNQKTFMYKNLNEVIRNLSKIIVKGNTVLFIGSFFLVSDAIKALKLQKHFN